MNPAFSVIFFTSASGAGYGLLAVVGILSAAGLPAPETHLGVCAVGLALVLITAGLLSSTAHLGHPERAWRALSQWRSSWLSREGLFAVLTYIPAGCLFLGQILPENPLFGWIGWGPVAAIMALVTVYSTGKIYHSLKTIRQWSDRQVVPGYLLIGLLGGGLLMLFLTAVFGAFHEDLAWTVVALAMMTGMLKASYWRGIDAGESASTPNSATGLGAGGETVRLLDAPTTSENFVMREMGFRIARKHVRKLRQIILITLFVAPAMITLTASLSGIPAFALILLTAAGVFSGGLGTVVERWLFFAEAKHAVTLYYGADAV